ncbi:DUF58 domain-containing protein [Methylovulum miyakonense]|uniref:DUF58 domain-containing protein n=1 Tax=Methylovulum miyakonense TaxID=645578 RepID=UPI000360D18C|nr:DUF58 domain-containing protein [Methylovulum miyakonense]
MTSLTERVKAHRFFAGEKATENQPMPLTHRRIFILPTQRGLGFAVLIILLFLIAFVYNNNLAYLLTFLIASIFFITITHSFKSLSGLIVQPGQSKPVFAGTAAGFDIHLDNPNSTPRQHLQITLESTESLTLAAQSKTTVTLYSATHKRGWHEAGKVTIASSYPLGLFRAWSPIRFNLKVLVYPKPATQSSPFPESSAGEIQQGFSKKGADDFYGMQEYQPGDPIKHIHWKAYAKGLGLYSKQYGGGNSAQIWLDYGQTSGNDTEARLSQLCRWVIEADQAGLSYGFILPGLRLPPDSGVAHTQKCLEALALF